MRRRLLDFLVCPIDRGTLRLVAWSERTSPLDDAQRAKAKKLGIDIAALEHEIEDGVLVNDRLGVAYPIDRGVPRMLVFPTPLHEDFARRHAEKLAEAGARFPDLPSAPGEDSVLKSFSREWTDYGWDERTYWGLPAEVHMKCMDFITTADERDLDGKRALEVGIGIGAYAHRLASSRGCEVVGVDLGFAVDAAHKHFGDEPFLHIVQCSIFRPSFAEETFDFVYSFGVIHHTYSTKAAFDQLSRLPRAGGALFVWVYSHHDEERSAKRRALMQLENVVRPVIARLPNPAQTIALAPFVPMYVVHQAFLAAGSGEFIRYGVREALHAARDRFTPLFIHRHSDDELKSWFMSAGYEQLVAASDRSVPEFVPEAFTACAGVAGVRRSHAAHG
jgi:uncharacterized protein YbaR (Trm112 family)/2-polyprenyl-3-methyl-5-hydroxy-6-metoxy-1,4-benzoquinol methylase